MTVGLAPAFGSAAGADGGAKPPGAAKAAHGLPLGAADLPETRTTRRVQRGVTVTSIVRGVPDTTDVWTVEVSSPDAGNPDPDAPAVAITDEAEARTSAADLTSKGFDPRVEAVQTPRTADTGGLLGYRVRVGGSTDKAQADQLDAQVVATGHKASVVYTGWDADAGAQPSRGTWHLTVVRVDPRRFTGTVRGDYGPDFVNRETTSSLARSAGATVAVNAGFFVLDPAAGAPGDPAGVGVYRGHIESETTNGRPALILHSDARRTQIKRLWWRGRLLGRGDRSLRLTGLNRVPGLVRNCGVPGAEPTARPQQDVTCTRSSDTIAFDHAYGATTPTGLGAEVVLDRQGRVVSTDTTGGHAIPAHGTVVAAIGAAAPRLLAFAKRAGRLSVDSSLRTANGKRLPLDRGTTVINGAPVLVKDGRVHATPGRDGAVHPDDPSFYYGWAHKRNPRTFAGIDSKGRLVLVTADGRSTDSLGLSIDEAARVARSLGLRKAMNLDGGGSTAAVVKGTVVTKPSDATGERPIGDSIQVLR